MGHDDLQQGDGGGDGGKDHQQVEQDAEDGADGAHLVEHVLHGDKQQLGAAHGACGVQGEAAGHHGQTGHQGDQGVAHHDDQGVLLHVLLLVQIGTVGDHDAHAQRQGEEHLTAGGGEDADEVGDLGDVLDHGHTGNGADHGPVHQSLGGLIVTGAGDIARLEHILQAVQGTAVDHLLHGAAVGLQNGHGEVVAAQGAGPDDADHQQDEQGGHTHGTDLLNAVADAAHDNDQGDEHKDQTIDHGLALVGQQAAEHLGAAQAAGAEAGVEEAAQVHGDILDAVAAQSAVERQDQEGCDDTQPAQPLEALGEDLIGADDAAAGLAAQGQLTHHDDEAAQRRQDQIDDQEREAAVGAHLVGEAPDVAKAHCRSHGSHQEPECGSKAFSFFH